MPDWPPVTEWTIGFVGDVVAAPFTDGTYFQDQDGTLWGWSGEAVETDGRPTTVWTIEQAAEP